MDGELSSLPSSLSSWLPPSFVSSSLPSPLLQDLLLILLSSSDASLPRLLHATPRLVPVRVPLQLLLRLVVFRHSPSSYPSLLLDRPHLFHTDKGEQPFHRHLILFSILRTRCPPLALRPTRPGQNDEHPRVRVYLFLCRLRIIVMARREQQLGSYWSSRRSEVPHAAGDGDLGGPNGRRRAASDGSARRTIPHRLPAREQRL
jgi:hypothetical protein